jgi:cell division septation protein DedD
MDIANYLSELLGLHGKINVPGLGYFVHVRVSAYYNDTERKFYPPGYKIQFDPQNTEGDETLTRYIAEKKKISLASSKYFTDKYITALKQEAALQEVPFADLGWFYMDKGKIGFKSRVTNTDNASYYGLEAINIKKLNQPAEPEKPAIVVATSVPVEVPIPALEEVLAPEPLPLPAPVREIHTSTAVDQPEEYYDDEPENKRGIGIWAIVLIVLIVLGAAAFAIYKYKPEWLNLTNDRQMVLPSEPKAKPVIKPDTDTIKKTVTPVDTVKAISKPDTALNTTIINADTIKKTHYELLAGAFKKQAEANKTVLAYKKMGFNAHILQNVPGRLIKITLGTYFVREEAVEAKQKILNTGKLSDDQITIQQYNHKK